MTLPMPRIFLAKSLLTFRQAFHLVMERSQELLNTLLDGQRLVEILNISQATIL